MRGLISLSLVNNTKCDQMKKEYAAAHPKLIYENCKKYEVQMLETQYLDKLLGTQYLWLQELTTEQVEHAFRILSKGPPLLYPEIPKELRHLIPHQWWALSLILEHLMLEKEEHKLN